VSTIMAFDGGYYDTFSPSTFDDYEAPATSFEPQAGLSRARQSAWDEGETSINGYGESRPQDAGYAAALGQHWSNDTPWAADWSIPIYSPHSTQSLHASALIPPDLSSPSTSRRSSLHPPFTPASAGRTPSPTQMKRMSSQHAFHTGHEFLTSNVQTRQQALSGSKLVTKHTPMSHDFSPDAYPYNTFEYSALSGFHSSPIQKLGREEYKQEVAQNKAPTSFRRSSLLKNRTGVWEMNDDRSWSQRKRALTSDAKSLVRAVHTGLHPDSTHRTQNAHEEVDVEPEKLYTPVYCDQCGVEFTGKYRTSNLRRHQRLKHAEAEPRKYACQLCGKAFKRSDARLGHERKKHTLLL
jgi:hypothetical protein